MLARHFRQISQGSYQYLIFVLSVKLLIQGTLEISHGRPLIQVIQAGSRKSRVRQGEHIVHLI
jgi:hypothetical protein